MALFGRDKSRKKRPKSDAERIREFVFNAPLKSREGDEEKQDTVLKPDTKRLYELAKELQATYETISHPRELLDQPLFQQGVEILEHPGFSYNELILFGQGDNELIAQMALYALSCRRRTPDLKKELLGFMDRVGIWRRFFILEALKKHVSHNQPLVGEICLISSKLPPEMQQMFHTFWADFIEDRLSRGEVLTFAGKLDDLDPQKAGSLQKFLALGAEETFAPLIQELDEWLETFVDLSVLRSAGAIWGEIDGPCFESVIEHDDLVQQAESICQGLEQLPRRSSLIIGERGCGKTAVMRTVGQRLISQGWLIFEANGPDLVAGQKFIGEFEERLKLVVTQLSGQRKALWFTSDFPSLQMAGTHERSRSGALDMLIPLVDSGQIVMVGEARPEAFEKLLQHQPRCLTAFNLVRIPPLEEKPTLDLARQWAIAHSPNGEEPLVAPEVLQEAWLLAGQYLQERVAPGNLLEFLQQSRQGLSAEEGRSNFVTGDDLIATLGKLTSLPAAILDDRQPLDTAEVLRFFNERILGQPEAVECLVQRISIIKSGLADPSRPQGVFLFAGPTGTGKTQIAKALATYLFGSENRLIRLDMSEFQNPQSLDRLTGRGDEDDRQSLAFRVRKEPFSVILLDEFEKSDPRVWDLFLQVFDDGRLTDAQGRTTDFRHALILLTSNLGAQIQTGRSLGFSKDHEGFRVSDVDKAIAKVFRPEFLNRLDQVVVFRPLSREVMRQILVKELREIKQRRGLRNRNWEVVWEDSASDFLLDRGFSLDLGARPLKRAVERHLLAPLAETIVSRQFPEGDQFLYIHSGGDRLQVEFIDPHEPEPENPSEDDLLDAEETTPEGPQAPTLAGIALAPQGKPAEVKLLQDRYNKRRNFLESETWLQAKDLALSMISLPDIWSSPERFPILGEVEYRERVENGLKTAGTLLAKIEPDPTQRQDHFSRRMVGQVAERLLLVDRACQALASQEPWEAFIALDIRTDSGVADARDRLLLARIRDMYLNWATLRKMQVKVLQDPLPHPEANRPVVLAVSGFAAFSILKKEEGLHVWEIPSLRKNKSFDHHQLLVRVGPQPEEISGVPGADLLPAALELVATPLPGAPVIVRHYRELPAPMVKDRVHGWRTGRLDRVLEGNFDLLNIKAEGDRKSKAGTG